MAMTLASVSGDNEVLMEVNTTPLIDVMLVLLVMLIITIPMQLHSVPLTLGGNPSASEVPPVVHEVAVDFDGTVYWDQKALANATALDEKLREVGAETPAQQHEVHIRASRLTAYGDVAAVMASAQRHGVRKMSVTGNEQYR